MSHVEGLWLLSIVLRYPESMFSFYTMVLSTLNYFLSSSMGLVLHSGLCKKCQVPHSHLGGGHGHSHGGLSHSNHSHMTESTDDSIGTDAQTTERENINVRAAMIHVIGDLIQSIGVFIAAVIIKVKVRDSVA